MSTTTFTLEKVGGANQSFADWGLGKFTIASASLAADRLTVEATGRAVDAARLFESGDTVKLHRIVTPDAGAPTDVVEFVGTCWQPSESGAGTTEQQVYEFHGPWDCLENLPLQQLWTVSDGAGGITTQYRSRCHLFSAVDASYITLAATITDILNYARDAIGAQFQIGTIEPAIYCPPHEAADVSCAGAIKECLKYAPDAVQWFDYATNPPTINIRRAANLTAVSIAPTGNAERLAIQRNRKQEVSEVVIFYELGDPANSLLSKCTIDAYPVDAAGRTYGALCASVNLQGRDQTVLRQEVGAYLLSPAKGEGGSQINWWASHVPELAKDLLDGGNSIRKLNGDPGIDFGEVAINQLDEDGSLIGDLNYNNPTALDYFPKELVAGAITPWMQTSGSVPAQVKATRARLECKISYYLQGDINSGQDQGKRHEELHAALAVELIATDATTRQEPHPYECVTGLPYVDAPPAGLAASLYAALNRPQYTGSIELTSAEVGAIAIGVGNTLNLTGLRAEWATMGALVTSVHKNYETGTVTVTFGPPPQIAFGDLVDLMMKTRWRRIPDLGLRATGQVGGGNRNINGTHWTPATRGTLGKGAGAFQQFQEDASNNNVIVDPKNGVMSVTAEVDE